MRKRQISFIVSCWKNMHGLTAQWLPIVSAKKKYWFNMKALLGVPSSHILWYKYCDWSWRFLWGNGNGNKWRVLFVFMRSLLYHFCLFLITMHRKVWLNSETERLEYHGLASYDLEKYVQHICRICICTVTLQRLFVVYIWSDLYLTYWMLQIAIDYILLQKERTKSGRNK